MSMTPRLAMSGSGQNYSLELSGLDAKELQNAERIKKGAWNESQWEAFANQTVRKAVNAEDDRSAITVITKAARTVLKTYSTSFFIVTRFLPPEKRNDVELIYAAVRYPDEVVDSFPLSAAQKISRLRTWRYTFDRALGLSVHDGLRVGLPVFAVGFADVVRRHGIPPEYYHAFLDAMESDTRYRTFATLQDLIDSYIYGSAIVVGYFLAYVYGTSPAGTFKRIMESSRDLGIALQLTNFVRDVGEDRIRRRLYLPTELLEQEGLTVRDIDAKKNRHAHFRVIHRFALYAEEYYDRAEANLDAFSPDCHHAIRSCIGVYRSLNRRILSSTAAIDSRISLPWYHKFRHLPISKYWKIPAGFLRSAL